MDDKAYAQKLFNSLVRKTNPKDLKQIIIILESVGNLLSGDNKQLEDSLRSIRQQR